MKNNAGEIIIIDTATEREYNTKHFEGAINIHYSEMPHRYNEIPRGSKVILHCRLGMVVPNAYKVLKEKRKDLQSIVYIDGAPLFDEYNNWIKKIIINNKIIKIK
ncbi:rhodanese-like domain-containing protein [Brachyspira murdochii]|uniref:rhodanese-like domain-containing protein n=1 Tax=Brachyspira murdochii TaxID=84378 RepID=UPI0018DF0E03|nr:rhodanese-like domain-containing protein [Brachyspira murdochii]